MPLLICLQLIYINFRILSLTIFIALFVSSTSENIGKDSEVCEIGKHSECTDHRTGEIYSDEYNVILQNIQSTLHTYIPCASESDRNCSCYAKTITNDLNPFREKGITREIIDSSAKYGTKYKIFNHKLYREDRCMFPARCSGIEHFIRPIVGRLQNMDFIVNTRDWPQIRSGFGQKYPVFSFSKTKDYMDIMYPAWSFWCGGPAISLHPTGIGRWDMQRETLRRAAAAYPWNKKISKAFFRGSRTSDERDTLILLSRRTPQLVDAQYTKNQAWKSSKDTLHAEPAKEVPFEEHCRYKYLFNFRGVAASFRLKHLFLCESLVFHVGEEWNEFFYYAMKPWVHYIPLQSYPTEQELESILGFFKKHDDLALEIAERGFDFIWNHLRMEDVECYWERLLREYQLLIKYKIEIEKDMLEI